MSDIVVEIKNTKRLYELLDFYIDEFFKEPHWSGERYKWEAVKHFQDVWNNSNEQNFSDKLKGALSKTGNLLAHSQVGGPRQTILNYAVKAPNETKELFDMLSADNLGIADIIQKFRDKADIIREKSQDGKNHFQDANTVTTYLWLLYPEKYYIYKATEYKSLVKQIDVKFIGKANNYSKCYALYDKLCKFLKSCNRYSKISEIIKKCKAETGFEDKELRLFISDFAFFVGEYVNKIIPEKKIKDMKNHPQNIIFYGPPGTGKTYNTVFKAMEIINDKPYGNHDKATYEAAKAEYDKLAKDGRIQFVTFHQSYSYEDFIEGIKPKIAENEGSEQTDSGQVEYEIKDGIFKEFCIAADPTCVIREKDKDKPQEQKEAPTDRYVFIIDEINRGNISKIFGELITLIEEIKRKGKTEETSAILPYSGDSFTVPDNVYIIGTMNTADRSLAVVDTALRRRFTFKEMMPKPAKLQGIEIGGINISELLEVMNDRITALYDREHTIGHAYFMNLSSSSTIKDLGNIFKNNIIPLLQEYFYEDYEKIRLVLGDNQKENKEMQFIQKEEYEVNDLFGNNNDLNIDKVISYSINEKAFYKPDAYKFFKQKNKVDTQNKTQESQGSNQ